MKINQVTVSSIDATDNPNVKGYSSKLLVNDDILSEVKYNRPLLGNYHGELRRYRKGEFRWYFGCKQVGLTTLKAAKDDLEGKKMTYEIKAVRKKNTKGKGGVAPVAFVNDDYIITKSTKNNKLSVFSTSTHEVVNKEVSRSVIQRMKSYDQFRYKGYILTRMDQKEDLLNKINYMIDVLETIRKLYK